MINEFCSGEKRIDAVFIAIQTTNETEKNKTEKSKTMW